MGNNRYLVSEQILMTHPPQQNNILSICERLGIENSHFVDFFVLFGQGEVILIHPEQTGHPL